MSAVVEIPVTPEEAARFRLRGVTVLTREGESYLKVPMKTFEAAKTFQQKGEAMSVTLLCMLDAGFMQ